MSENLIRWLIENYGQYAVTLVLAIAVIGMALGSLKRGISSLLGASLNAGDRVMTRIVEKPKAVTLVGCVTALVAPSFVAGYKLTPPKVVEKVVVEEVKVADTTEIDRLSGLLGEAERERSAAQARARLAEGQLGPVQQQLREANGQTRQALARIAELQAEVTRLTPPTDDKAEYLRLVRLLDDTHENGTQREVSQRPFDYQRHKSSQHIRMLYDKQVQETFYYHRSCAICEENHKMREEMDAVLRRHPAWGWQDVRKN